MIPPSDVQTFYCDPYFTNFCGLKFQSNGWYSIPVGGLGIPRAIFAERFGKGYIRAVIWNHTTVAEVKADLKTTIEMGEIWYANLSC